MKLFSSSFVSILLAGAASVSLAKSIQMPKPILTDPGQGGVRVDQAGVIGNYFQAPQPGRRPGILLLGGSEGGLGSGAVRQARLLAQQGFDVLEIVYFGAPSQPEMLADVPLETFDRGLAWLRDRPEVDPGETGVVGSSKGAEAGAHRRVARSRHQGRGDWNAVQRRMARHQLHLGAPGVLGHPRGSPVAYLPYVVNGPFNIYDAYDDGLKALASASRRRDQGRRHQRTDPTGLRPGRHPVAVLPHEQADRGTAEG